MWDDKPLEKEAGASYMKYFVDPSLKPRICLQENLCRILKKCVVHIAFFSHNTHLCLLLPEVSNNHPQITHRILNQRKHLQPFDNNNLKETFYFI